MEDETKPRSVVNIGIVLGGVFLGLVGGAMLGGQETVDRGMLSVDSPFIHQVVGGIEGAVVGGVLGFVIVLLKNRLNRGA